MNLRRPFPTNDATTDLMFAHGLSADRAGIGQHATAELRCTAFGRGFSASSRRSDRLRQWAIATWRGADRVVSTEEFADESGRRSRS